MSDATPMPTQPSLIKYDDFAKLDLRVGRVVEAANHPNADRLLVLKVDIGTEQRQLVAGIRGYYEPEQLVGRLVIVLKNLEPRAMRGVESLGMVLAASTDDRAQVILLAPSADIAPGSKVS